MKKLRTWILRGLRCAVILPAKLYRCFHPDLWLIGSRPDEADGNALTLYHWIGNKRKCVFVLNKEAPQSRRGMIKWGGLKHMFYSAAAPMHVFDVEEIHFDIISPRMRKLFGLETKHIFLQHGIIRLNIPLYHYSRKKYDLFVVSAKKEYEFVHSVFGYPYNHLALTGLARYDQLIGKASDKRFVLIMPTWRRSLFKMNETEFMATAYYQRFQSLLNNKDFQAFLRENDLKLCFYLHYKIHDKQRLFSLPPDSLMYTATEQVHELLRACSLLITDCSSVAFDVALAGKPLLYYGFEEEHYPPGDSYMQLDTDGFGPVVRDEQSILEYMNTIWDGQCFRRESIYDRRCDDFFTFRDTNNCQRIYDAIEAVQSRSS